MENKTLPCSEIAIGHCVIINHVEQPCGRLLAVVVAVGPNFIGCQYLNSEESFDSYNRKGVAARRSEVTPVADFGVEVRCEGPDDAGDHVYTCEPVGESKATYSDGGRRPWQEYGYRGRYVARPDVLEVVRKAR